MGKKCMLQERKKEERENIRKHAGWEKGREKRVKKIWIIVKSVLVCHLLICFVVVRNDTDGRKLLVGVVWQ